MEWNNPFSTINSAFAKISLFAWWPFTIPRWSLRENWMWENSFVATISMVLLNLCAKKKKVSGFFFIFLADVPSTPFLQTTNQIRCPTFDTWFGPLVLQFWTFFPAKVLIIIAISLYFSPHWLLKPLIDFSIL